MFLEGRALTQEVLEKIALPHRDIDLLQQCVIGDLLGTPKPLTGPQRSRLSDELATRSAQQILAGVLGPEHKVQDANRLRKNQPGYDFIVDGQVRIQVKAGSYVESFGWTHKVGGSGADLEFDLLLGVDLGVMLEGRHGRLAQTDLGARKVPDFYCIPGETVREWVRLGRRVNARGAHIYHYKRCLKPGTREEQKQTLELRDYINRFDLLSAAVDIADTSRGISPQPLRAPATHRLEETKFKLYFITDPRVPDACKIGKDTLWPKRYQQALCHSPAPLSVERTFSFSNHEDLKKAEKDIARVLAPFKRPGDANEWYDLTSTRCANQLRTMTADWRLDTSVTTPTTVARRGKLPYDDWRDAGKKWSDYRWHLWLLRENQPNPRWKLIFSSLFDTFYRYAFTYNPFPVRLMGAFEAMDGVDGVSHLNRKSNQRLMELWHEMMERYGTLESFQVGWLPEGTDIAQLVRDLQSSGLALIDLQRPKPSFVRPKDSSIPQVAVGSVPPLYRVGTDWIRPNPRNLIQ